MTFFDHDFKKYPELTNTELQTIGFTSPHVQITEDFEATVVKVHDGDTVTLSTNFRDFEFPLRFLLTNAPELNENGGKESKEWLSNQILGATVQILINKNNRVGKYGRLLGEIVHTGMSMNETSIINGYATPFSQRNEGKIESFDKIAGEGAI